MAMLHRMSGYWLVLHWAGFTWLVLDGGRNPGLVAHPDSVSYPAAAVIGDVLLLAALTAWMARLLYRAPARQLIRWLESAALVSILLVLASAIVITDQPGNVYAVAYFALLSMILFAVHTLARLRPERTPVSASVSGRRDR
jgi:hypothetical protein